MPTRWRKPADDEDWIQAPAYTDWDTFKEHGAAQSAPQVSAARATTMESAAPAAIKTTWY